MRNLKKGASLASYGLMPLFDSLNTSIMNTYNMIIGLFSPISASLGVGTTTTGMGAAGGAGYYYKLITDLLGL